LRVGAISTALTGLMPATLRRLTADAPGIKPVIVPGTSRELYEGVADGSLDAALLAAPPFGLPRTLKARTLREEPLMLVTPLQGPYRLDASRRGRNPDAGGQGVISTPSNAPHRSPDALARMLQSLPYIRYDPQAWGGRHAARWLEDQHIAPPVVCDLDALETIVMLVSDGVGFSLLPGWHGIERLAHGCRLTLLAPASEAGTVADTTHLADRTGAQRRADTHPHAESDGDGDARRYARRIILLQAMLPDRPGMLAAFASALGIDDERSASGPSPSTGPEATTPIDDPATITATAAPQDDRSGS